MSLAAAKSAWGGWWDSISMKISPALRGTALFSQIERLSRDKAAEFAKEHRLKGKDAQELREFGEQASKSTLMTHARFARSRKGLPGPNERV